MHNDLFLQAEHLLICKLREADFRLAVIRITNHEKQIYERILGLLKLTDSVDGDFGNDSVHKHLDTRLVARGHNLLLTLLTFLYSLGKQLQAEWIKVILQTRLSVNVF